MHLRCGGIYNSNIIANLLMNLPVQEFENLLAFGKVMDKSLMSRFLTHSVVLLC